MEPNPLSPWVRFGAFELNRQTGELFKHGRKIKLQAQSFLVLASLLERPGEVLTREELYLKLWPPSVFVDFEVGLNAAVNRLRSVLSDSPENPRFIETLPRHGYRFIAPLQRESPERIPARVRSLAVLPLENLTGDAAQEYLADGMTDALITRLAQIGALRVISRTSVMHYKGTHKKLPEIASELNVDAIVEGSFARSGSHVRINAQLVHARTDQHLWARQYEREMTDILALQGDVAGALADEIRITLTPQERARLASARTIEPEAYEDYLRGRFFWNKRTPEGLKKSLQYYWSSLEKDPSYALAHAGLAECYNMMGYWGVLSPQEAYPPAKSEARAAVVIDESCAEAHTALGWTLFTYDWNWPEAKRELDRAVRLNPGYATARQWFSHYWIYLGKKSESLDCVKHTLELDPLSLVMNSNAAFMYFFARDFDAAVERARKTIELDPHFAPPYLCLGQALEQKALFPEAIQAFDRGLVHSERAPFMLAALGHAYAVSGNRSAALASLKDLEELSLRRYVSPYYFAVLSAGAGEAENSLTWLEHALEDRSSWLAWLKVDPRFDALREQPRFQALLCKIGLSS
jgi:TolB-like protein/Tfp pilus assembly protein PilF